MCMLCSSQVIVRITCFLDALLQVSTSELPHEKTNNVVFEQVLHKPGCTATEDS